MFERNDKQLLTVRVITNVVTWILTIVGIIAGVVLSALEMLAIGLSILFVVPFLCWLMWVYVRLHLSHLCDIKLIRNKLYGVDNDNLKVFLEGKFTKRELQETELIKAQKTEKMTKLKALRDSGVLPEQEYQNEINKILGGTNK